MTPIKKFTATGENARFLAHLNQVIDRLNSITASSSSAELVSITTKGTSRKPKNRSTVQSGSGIASQFRVKSVSDNHLVCRAWDGTNEGTEDIKVAKPYTLRKTSYTTSAGGSTTMTINGKSFTVSAVDSNTRQLSFGGTNWRQVINPAYNTNDVVYAIQSDPTLIASDASIQFVDLNIDGRTWATRLPVCDSGVSKVMIVSGLPPA